jgi:hypothetical protein
VRAVGDRFFFWTPCLDQSCLTRGSSLFLLGEDSLAPIDEAPYRLPGDLVDAVDSIEAGKALLTVSTPSPSVWLSNLDLGELQQIPLDVNPVGRIATRGGVEQVFLGLPLAVGDPVQVVAVQPGPKVVERSTGFVTKHPTPPDISALTALSADGERAAFLLEDGAALSRVTVADGHLESCNLEAGGSGAWYSMEFISADQLLIVSSGWAQGVRFSDCAVQWKFAHPTGVQAAAAAGQGRIALLTGGLDFLVLDGGGNVLSQKPSVPGRSLTSNLLVASSGVVYYALENLVVGRKL